MAIDIELLHLLDEKYLQYNTPEFIESDPISVPHQFAQKENIEIAGFLAASIAWGQRVTIVRNAERLVALMGTNPYDFLVNAHASDYSVFEGFCHRTYNAVDTRFFMVSLASIYKNHGGLEAVFTEGYTKTGTIAGSLDYFRSVFLSVSHEKRSEKHVANRAKGASAKRLNMFLRWMVRRDSFGVDFGLWKKIDPAKLFLPLDLHTGNVARSLGLLERKQNDWQAVEELTGNLTLFDPSDPVKYDFALFGMGIFENLKMK